MSTSRQTLLQTFLRERDTLLRRIQRMVSSEAIAEDLVQEAFTRLWQRELPQDSPGLLYRTAQNLALDYLRSQKVRERHQQQDPELTADRPNEADQQAIAAQECDALTATLHGLPERTRQVFLLNRLEGETYAAIADKLGLSVSTVEKDMMRAMLACRRCLQQMRDER